MPCGQAIPIVVESQLFLLSFSGLRFDPNFDGLLSDPGSIRKDDVVNYYRAVDWAALITKDAYVHRR
jgi:hypothetical protein